MSNDTYGKMLTTCIKAKGVILPIFKEGVKSIREGPTTH